MNLIKRLRTQRKDQVMSKAYAGKMCVKCKKGKNNEIPSKDLSDLCAHQQKRYGGYVCNNCLKKYKTT